MYWKNPLSCNPPTALDGWGVVIYSRRGLGLFPRSGGRCGPAGSEPGRESAWKDGGRSPFFCACFKGVRIACRRGIRCRPAGPGRAGGRARHAGKRSGAKAAAYVPAGGAKKHPPRRLAEGMRENRAGLTCRRPRWPCARSALPSCWRSRTRYRTRRPP